MRRHAQEIAKSVKYKKSGVLDLAAVLHDIGNLKNRDLHHLIGPDMIKADKKLNKEVAPQTLKAILNAVRSHRASDTATPPKSQLAKIVNDADRLDSTLGRALVYRLKKFPNMKMDDAVLDAAKHHTGKYGPKGYGLKATYFPRTTKITRDSMVEINKAFSKKDVKKLTEIAQACNYYKSFIGKADKSPS